MRRRRRKPKRRGYVRPSRAKPKTGWTLRQLATLSGVAVRTIRLYLQREVLPRPPFMGSATRYQARQLVHLIAIRRLRSAEKLTLATIRTRLQALSPDEIQAFATENLGAGPIADALGIKPPPGPPPRSVSGLATYIATVGVPPASIRRWMHFELALGLELHVRDDASAKVFDLARRIQELSAYEARERGNGTLEPHVITNHGAT